MDKEKMFDQIIELLAMRKKLIDLASKVEKGLNEEEIEKDELNSLTGMDCPIAKELEKEYKDILLWCFGDEIDIVANSKGKAIENWVSLHPNLPIPRILQSLLKVSTLNTIALLMDVVPYYQEDKKRKCKCANAN